MPSVVMQSVVVAKVVAPQLQLESVQKNFFKYFQLGTEAAAVNPRGVAKKLQQTFIKYDV